MLDRTSDSTAPPTSHVRSATASRRELPEARSSASCSSVRRRGKRRSQYMVGTRSEVCGAMVAWKVGMYSCGLA